MSQYFKAPTAPAKMAGSNYRRVDHEQIVGVIGERNNCNDFPTI